MDFEHRLCIAACVASITLAGAAQAATVVAPSAYDDTAGYEYQTSIFGNGSTSSVTFQEGFAAYDLGSLKIGTLITGIGYRLASNLPTITDAVDYLDFNIKIGTSTVSIANLSLSADANEGADTIDARSGALALPGESLVNNAGLNPFYTIVFARPYTYEGGDLLVTTSYSVAGAVPFIGVDAVDPFGAINTLGGNDPAFLRTHSFNAPVVQFTTGFAAVPEPSSWLLLILGFGVVGVTSRRRGRPASVNA